MNLVRRAAFTCGLLRGLWRQDIPSMGVFFIAEECNAKCPYCFNVFLPHLKGSGGARGTRGARLSLDEYRRIAEGLEPLFQAVFSGGEPFLRGEIAEIAGVFYRNAGTRLFSIPTNGSLPDKVLGAVERMAASCPRATFTIQVSLDACGARHDELRGLPGGFDKAVGLGHGLLELGRRLTNVEFVVNTAVTDDTLREIPALQEFLKDEFSGRLRYHNLQWDQRLGERFSGTPSLLERTKSLADGAGEAAVGRAGPGVRLIRKYYQGFVNALILEQMDRGRMIYRCNAGRKLLVMMPDGRVAPCEPFLFEERYRKFPALNIRDYGYSYARLSGHPDFESQLGFIGKGSCAACPWSCAAASSMIYSPANWPLLFTGLSAKARS